MSLSAACTAQAPTADNPLQLVVGADGGSLTSDGLRMELPAGAVGSSVTLTAFPTDRVINGVTTASHTWIFGPGGQVFNTPIAVGIAFTGAHDAATVAHFSEGGDADSGGEGHQDGGDHGEEADGEHGDNGHDADCEHDDLADDGDGGGDDGHDDGDDSGESDD